MRITLRQLEVFTEVLKSGSTTQASQQLALLRVIRFIPSLNLIVMKALSLLNTIYYARGSSYTDLDSLFSKLQM